MRLREGFILRSSREISVPSWMTVPRKKVLLNVLLVAGSGVISPVERSCCRMEEMEPVGGVMMAGVVSKRGG